MLWEVFEIGESIGVQTGTGILLLDEVQLEGKERLDIRTFIRGYQDFIGSIFNKTYGTSLGQRSRSNEERRPLPGTSRYFLRRHLHPFLKPLFKILSDSSGFLRTEQNNQNHPTSEKDSSSLFRTSGLPSDKGKDLGLSISGRKGIRQYPMSLTRIRSEEKLSTYITKKPGPYIVVFSLDQGCIASESA